MYICLTCHGHLKKQSEPLQAVWKNLDIISPTKILLNLIRVEKVLTSCRILFKKKALSQKVDFQNLKEIHVRDDTHMTSMKSFKTTHPPFLTTFKIFPLI